MTFMKSLMGATAMALTAGAALAEPAIIFDLGGKFDKSFNEAAYTGAERWKAATGGAYVDLELQSDAQREQALRRFASQGNNPIVMASFSWPAALSAVAPEFADTNFVVLDAVVEAPNVQSVLFAERTRLLDALRVVPTAAPVRGDCLRCSAWGRSRRCSRRCWTRACRCATWSESSSRSP